jgi:hypothetical protein
VRPGEAVWQARKTARLSSVVAGARDDPIFAPGYSSPDLLERLPVMIFVDVRPTHA